MCMDQTRLLTLDGLAIDGIQVGYSISFPSRWLRDTSYGRVRPYVRSGDQPAPSFASAMCPTASSILPTLVGASEGLGGSFRLSRGVVAQEFVLTSVAVIRLERNAYLKGV